MRTYRGPGFPCLGSIVMDLVTIAPDLERPNDCSSSPVTQRAPEAFIKQLGNFTPAIVVDRSMKKLLHRMRVLGYLTHQPPICHLPDIVRRLCRRPTVGHEQNGVPELPGKGLQQTDDLSAGLGVQIPRWLVGQ